MNTRIYRTDREPLDQIVKACAALLEKGELVAFPTETVYGLGGNGLNAEAARKIYEAKGRPSDNPLILHIGQKEQLYGLVKEVPETAEKLTEAFWPGPLTLIFEKADCVPETTSGGLNTVAVRFPSHPAAMALLQACDFPVAAPSANLSGRPSTTRGSHVIDDLNGRISAIIDAGDVPIGVESTILDLTAKTPVMLRPGFITASEIEDVLGIPVRMDPAITRENIISHSIETVHPKAPGMKYRHYAPKAPVVVVSGKEEAMIAAIRAHADASTGILTVDEHVNCYDQGVVMSAGSRTRPEEILHNLFDVLRSFDEVRVDRILAEDLTEEDTTGALMNRLLKSAGGDFRQASEL